jgi:predicted TIM-barrel fold metal-dependent hydrolase
MKIVDTHQHLWDLDLFRYSWLQGFPTLNRPFRMSDYLQASQGLEIEKTIHVECDVDEQYMLDETRHILHLAEQMDNPLEGVVACGRPESKDFKAYLDKIFGHPKLKGIRRVLHTQADDLAGGQTFIENVGGLASYGFSFDICVLARQLPVAINLISKCPDVTFILDHCGVPQVREKVLEPWCSEIRELAKFPRLVCKISGLVAYADPTKWTADDLRPYIEHVIECFGWDRVLFGSDWPVCTLSASYQQWVSALRSITKQAGEANRNKLFHDNAIRVYGLAKVAKSGSQPQA